MSEPTSDTLATRRRRLRGSEASFRGATRYPISKADWRVAQTLAKGALRRVLATSMLSQRDPERLRLHYHAIQIMRSQQASLANGEPEH
jgi:hypothetical protein